MSRQRLDAQNVGSQNFIKQVSAANFKLKGSGWYETDFKNKPKETKKNNNN